MWGRDSDKFRLVSSDLDDNRGIKRFNDDASAIFLLQSFVIVNEPQLEQVGCLENEGNHVVT